MADMANIVDFNSSDGLPPWVIQKLNHNFWGVVQKIVEDQVVMVASITEPSPRTDETLLYKTDTGDLYLWSLFENNPPSPSPQEPHWDWKKLDLGFIHIDPDTPWDSDYRREEEVLWYETTTGKLFIYTDIYIDGVGSITPARWHSIHDLIAIHVGYEISNYSISGGNIVIPDDNMILNSLASFLNDYNNYS